MGHDDKACHASEGRRTSRTEVMFSEGGVYYVYLIYGMYHCLNVVSGEKDSGEAVLIRSAEIIDGRNEASMLRYGKDFSSLTCSQKKNLSNGPGNPTDVPEVIQAVKRLRGKYPIFGICLGHQIISLAYGAKTYKLKFGHRGGNHPVRNLETGKIEITSQNHSYAVDTDSLSGTKLTVTHLNLLDSTVEGVKCEEDRVFSVQYHPESAPGPQDSAYLFDRFISMMEKGKRHA